MKKLFPLIALSLTLTACADGANGTNGNGTDGQDGSASSTHIVNPLNNIGTGNTTPETATFDANNASFSALEAKAKADGELNVTLQGMAVMLTNSNNRTELSRIISPSFDANYMPAVTLRFAADGAMTATNAYADTEYSNPTVDKSDIFGFTADYMALITWNEKSDATFSYFTPPPHNQI